MNEKRITEELEYLDAWARVLTMSVTKDADTTMHLLTTVGIGHAMECGALPAGLAGWLRQLAEAIERDQDCPSIKEVIKAANTWEKSQSGLETGRKVAAENRTKTAEEKQKTIKKAVDDLFTHGEGYRMTNKRIASYLKKNGFSDYTFETTLTHVKKAAKLHREKDV